MPEFRPLGGLDVAMSVVKVFWPKDILDQDHTLTAEGQYFSDKCIVKIVYSLGPVAVLSALNSSVPETDFRYSHRELSARFLEYKFPADLNSEGSEIANISGQVSYIRHQDKITEMRFCNIKTSPEKIFQDRPLYALISKAAAEDNTFQVNKTQET